jgi:hypothetical protein
METKTKDMKLFHRLVRNNRKKGTESLVELEVNDQTYGFLFRSEKKFQTTRELEYLFFLSRQARNFFPEFNIRLYDKNSILQPLRGTSHTYSAGQDRHSLWNDHLT